MRLTRCESEQGEGTGTRSASTYSIANSSSSRCGIASERLEVSGPLPIRLSPAVCVSVSVASMSARAACDDERPARGGTRQRRRRRGRRSLSTVHRYHHSLHYTPPWHPDSWLLACSVPQLWPSPSAPPPPPPLLPSANA